VNFRILSQPFQVKRILYSRAGEFRILKSGRRKRKKAEQNKKAADGMRKRKGQKRRNSAEGGSGSGRKI